MRTHGNNATRYGNNRLSPNDKMTVSPILTMVRDLTNKLCWTSVNDMVCCTPLMDACIVNVVLLMIMYQLSIRQIEVGMTLTVLMCVHCRCVSTVDVVYVCKWGTSPVRYCCNEDVKPHKRLCKSNKQTYKLLVVLNSVLFASFGNMISLKV